MNDADIRPASPDDAAAIAAVHVSSFLAAYAHLATTHRSAANGLAGRTEVWERLLRQTDGGHATLVATQDGAVCGFVRIGPSPDDDGAGHIFSIHVSPDMTGRGLGGRLMEAAVASLARAGFRRATLWVVADNPATRRFYERLGWQEEDVRSSQPLAVGDEKGNTVDVVRYRLDIGETE